MTGATGATGSAGATGAIGATGPAGEVTKDYLASRGGYELTNGQALMGTNYNFASFTLDKADHPTGAAGSFYPSSTSGAVLLDEYLPVNPSRTYEMAFSMRQAAGDGARRFYSMIAPFDIDKLSIQPYHYMEQSGTRTTLALDLNPGDTTVTLTSAANWNNAAGVNSYLRSFLFWNYTDGQGYTWPVGTYSRNRWNDMWADGSISGNVITLRNPWPIATIPAGTAVSNASSGGSYMYGISNTLGPSTWTDYGPYRYSGVHSNTLAAATTSFPIATAYVRAGFLVNYPTATPDPTSVQKFANVSFIDTASPEGKLTKAGDTMTGDLTFADGKNIITNTTTGTKIGTATTQKIGFFNASPVAQQGAATDLGSALANLGLRATGTAYPITTSGVVSLSGAVALGAGGYRSAPTSRSSAITLTDSSPYINLCNASTASFIITLPAANAASGQMLYFKKSDASANTITIQRAGTDTIEGAANYTLSAQYKYVELINDNASTWFIKANN